MLRVSLPGGYWRTTPANGALTIKTRASSLIAAGKNFGITNRATIGGSVFHDVNFNRRRDGADTQLRNHRVFIDLDGDGRFDATEPSALSAFDGTFRLEVTKPGTYRVRVVTPKNWMRTTVDVYSVVVGPGKAMPSLLFGQKKIM